MSSSVQSCSLNSPPYFVQSISQTDRTLERKSGVHPVQKERPVLRRMDEVIDRLWRVDNSRLINSGRHISNSYYRRSTLDSRRNLEPYEFTTSRNGEFSISSDEADDESLIHKNCRVRILHDFQKTGFDQDAGFQQNRRNGQDCRPILSPCFSKMKNSNPQFTSNGLNGISLVSLEDMEVTKLPYLVDLSFSSSIETSFGVLGMEFTSMNQHHRSNRATCSFTTCSGLSLSSKPPPPPPQPPTLRTCILSKWTGKKKKMPFKKLHKLRTQSGLTPLSEVNPVVGLKGNCFLCLGSSSQSTKHSIEDSCKSIKTPSSVSSDLNSVVNLTSSPLYGDQRQITAESVRKTPIEVFTYSSNQSLNIQATHNPTTEVSSDEEDLVDIWEDSDSEVETGPVFKIFQTAPVRISDLSSTRSWEPPVLKSDQEYEKYLLQSRTESVDSGKHPMDCLSIASWSSLDFDSE
eukprot:g4291.t1